jgi:hypothetical protein
MKTIRTTKSFHLIFRQVHSHTRSMYCPLHASCVEFAGTPMEMPLDSHARWPQSLITDGAARRSMRLLKCYLRVVCCLQALIVFTDLHRRQLYVLNCTIWKITNTLWSPSLIMANNYSRTIIDSEESRNSAVDIATGYGLDDQWVRIRVPVGARIFTSPCRPYRLWGPPSLLSNGYRGTLCPGVKRPGREADHSPPTSAEVKKTWHYVVYIHSPTSLHAVVLN